jgi:pyrimidine-nucleoside phosphorylase
MVGALEFLSKLRKSIRLNDRELRDLVDLKAEPVQQGAMLAGLVRQKHISRDVVAQFARRTETLTALHKLLRGSQAQLASTIYSGAVISRWGKLFGFIVSRAKVHPSIIRDCVRDFVDKAVPNEFVGAFLMLVCRFGLQDRDVLELTKAMAASGEIFDYRKDPRLRPKRMFRRYPTGGVSEKASLILPSLIAALAEERPLISPFLVARSLGFTGGTWDKLSSIPGFRFPEPGPETVETLVRCGVAMSVTHGAFNPADRILYQMRSVTDTIDSNPLIVSSIVSKQIVVPCDLLILDVRYGEGTFLETRERASVVGKAMCDFIQKCGIKCMMTLLDTYEPNGVTIGNALEVSEAITIMKGESNPLFDVRLQEIQKNIVIDFAAKGMAFLFPDSSPSRWAEICQHKFTKGDVWRHFKALLGAHNVADRTIDQLESDSLFLMHDCEQYEVRATKAGQIVAIDQEELGRTVNFELGAGGNEYAGLRDLYSGVILHRKLYDYVRKGDVIARLVSTSEGMGHKTKKIAAAFGIN